MSFVIPDGERQKQSDAIDPAASVWVSANAGSGKTTILTKRVVRLLLSGVDPAKILCLTFTKAAAAEMQNRVFSMLGGWVGLDDAALASEIETLEGRRPAARRLAAARRLFAEALETPGGLKIQTIHAFCERLLHLFPFEANVPARFRMLDDTEQAVILDACMAAAEQGLAVDDPEADRYAEALALVASEATASGFAKTLRSAMTERAALARFAGSQLAGEGDAALRAALGVAPGDDLDAIDRETVSGGLLMAEWPRAAEALQASGKSTDIALGAALEEAFAKADLAGRAEAYRALFFTAARTPKARLTTKDVPAALSEMLTQEQARIVALIERRKAVMTVLRTGALLTIAEHAAARYQEEKRRRAALDFGDLIARTATLFDRVDARWILYKLDAGLEHLLVDEAQDTSPEQWRILTALTAEFFAGEGQSAAHRTVFAVGDEKQSIFSFQGAAPKQFDQQRRLFKARVEQGQKRFSPVELQLSFRTVRDVLSAVDTVFAGDRFEGLGPVDAQGTVHETARQRQPGLVEIWPIEPPDAAEEKAGEDDEVDALPPRASEVKLAERIARRIAFWLRTGARYEDDGARIRAGDIMILVRQRKAFFECMIRALKRAGVPVAGADRMQLTAHIAVMDLLAAGEIALLSEDDLTLATVLKSPLIGLDDDDLIALVADRTETSLQASLREASAQPRLAAAHARIEGWRSLARDADPFAFFSTLLIEQGGRRRMLARLGQDAAEVMDVFLADVLTWQRQNTPSLVAFLAFMRGAERMVKRELESGTDAVRVMTAHAAKGLEARIVFLPDTLGALHSSQEPKLYDLKAAATVGEEPLFPEPPLLAWSPSARHDAAPVAAARAAWRREAIGESRRLLYVGMTRARDRLYIAGFGRKLEPAADVWYRMIDPALTRHAQSVEVAAEDDPAFVVRQWRSIERDPPAAPRIERELAMVLPLPGWLQETSLREMPQETPRAMRKPEIDDGLLRPSAVHRSSRQSPSDEATPDLRLRGVVIHALLERLPGFAPERRGAVADQILSAHLRDGAASDNWRGELKDEALRILSEPRFARIFGPSSRAEVEIRGSVLISGVQRLVTARIDRLIVLETEVLIADFKTGTAPADPVCLPADTLRQLALYRSLIGAIYPGRIIRAGVLWTSIPEFVFASESDFDHALAALSETL